MDWLMPVLSGAFAFAGAWGGLSVKLRWLTADLKRAHARIDRLEEPFFERRGQSRAGPTL